MEKEDDTGRLFEILDILKGYSYEDDDGLVDDLVQEAVFIMHQIETSSDPIQMDFDQNMAWKDDIKLWLLEDADNNSKKVRLMSMVILKFLYRHGNIETFKMILQQFFTKRCLKNEVFHQDCRYEMVVFFAFTDDLFYEEMDSCSILYFLDQCNTVHLTLPSCYQSLRVNESMFLSCILCCRAPREIPLLLSYGCLQDILGIMFCELCKQRIESDQGSKCYNLEDWLFCAKYILRALARLDLSNIEVQLETEDGVVDAKQSLNDLMKNLRETGDFPELNARMNKVVTRLDHKCRLVIRDELQKNWALPGGIQRLELPNELKSFLNLERD